MKAKSRVATMDDLKRLKKEDARQDKKMLAAERAKRKDSAKMKSKRK